ncbi:COP9 signalosome complex subunit 3 [Lepeophtheirus salmonis]|nr:COP9 signalosome complex subunit 3-like [Lepeophtheirus salmonis]
MALEQFENMVKGLSDQSSFGELVDYLNKTGESVLTRNLGGLDALLDSLDFTEHSLGVIAVLSAKLQANADVSLDRISSFIMQSNPEQISFSPLSFASLVRLYGEECMRRQVPITAIQVLIKAIHNSQPQETTLTSLHAELCKLCLASKCLTPALPFLDLDYQDISEECASDSRYLLLFYYYGAMIYAANKNFGRALYFLEAVVTVPSSVISHIMFEAYKKYLLISLLIPDPSKDQQKLPKYTSPVINKFMKILCAPYHDIFSAFFTNKSDDLQDAIHKHLDTFTTDSNMGLIQQVVEAQIKMNIKRLTKTFLTLSLQDVASRVGIRSSADAERKLVEMIEEGSIQAHISQKDGMVRFDSNSEHFESVNMLQKLETNINNCINLDKQILLMDDEIILNPSFVRKSVLSSRELGEADDASMPSGGKTSSNFVSSGSKVPGYSM